MFCNKKDINIDNLLATVKRMANLRLETDCLKALKYSFNYCIDLYYHKDKEISKAEQLLRDAYESSRQVEPIHFLNLNIDTNFALDAIKQEAKYNYDFEQQLKSIGKDKMLDKQLIPMFIDTYNDLLDKKLQNDFYKQYIILDK